MFNDRHKVDHRLAVGEYVTAIGRRFARGVFDPLVRPIDTSVTPVFVVGCGHSGTTLVAAKLGRLDRCYCVGWETNAFSPDNGMFWSKAAFGTLLLSARSIGATVLLEKTPKHVHCLNRIRRLLPGARFIIVVRNALDTCASLYRRFGDLDYAIDRWNMDNAAASSALALPASVCVRYEELVSDPQRVLKRSAEFIGLEWTPSVVLAGDSAFSSNAAADSNMSLRAEQVSRDITCRVNVWNEVLTPAMADVVLARTMKVAGQLGYSV